MLLQSITVPNEWSGDLFRGVSWIHKYIFPGSMIPAMSEIEGVISEISALEIRNVEPIGQHYARTLQLWREQFFAEIDRVRVVPAVRQRPV